MKLGVERDVDSFRVCHDASSFICSLSIALRFFLTSSKTQQAIESPSHFNLICVISRVGFPRPSTLWTVVAIKMDNTRGLVRGCCTERSDSSHYPQSRSSKSKPTESVRMPCYLFFCHLACAQHPNGSSIEMSLSESAVTSALWNFGFCAFQRDFLRGTHVKQRPILPEQPESSRKGHSGENKARQKGSGWRSTRQGRSLWLN